MAIIKFAKSLENATIPSKRDGDMGYDLYACFEEEYIEIPIGGNYSFNTGIRSILDEEYGVLLRQRGSTGIRNMAVNAGVIDASYRGDWIVIINNTGNKPLVIAKHPDDFNPEMVTVYPYEKAIAQAVIVSVPKLEVQEVSLEEILVSATERGDGKLGSSGK